MMQAGRQNMKQVVNRSYSRLKESGRRLVYQLFWLHCARLHARQECVAGWHAGHEAVSEGGESLVFESTFNICTKMKADFCK